jgi:hypothetical protein
MRGSNFASEIMDEQAFENRLAQLAKAKRIAQRKAVRMEKRLDAYVQLDEMMESSVLEDVRGVFA